MSGTQNSVPAGPNHHALATLGFARCLRSVPRRGCNAPERQFSVPRPRCSLARRQSSWTDRDAASLELVASCLRSDVICPDPVSSHACAEESAVESCGDAEVDEESTERSISSMAWKAVRQKRGAFRLIDNGEECS